MTDMSESPKGAGEEEKMTSEAVIAGGREPRALTEAARRALKEAEERRRAADRPPAPQEIGGRGGLDPARYGDWEKNGVASDF